MYHMVIQQITKIHTEEKQQLLHLNLSGKLYRYSKQRSSGHGQENGQKVKDQTDSRTELQDTIHRRLMHKKLE